MTGLITDFFEMLDRIFNEQYYVPKYLKGKKALDTLLADMVAVAYSLKLGVLIIDEVQSLKIIRQSQKKKADQLSRKRLPSKNC